MSTTTQIDVDPPSSPDTPPEMPGTPNSATTSLSALSTTAIKDGHRGSAIPSAGHQHRLSANTLEAERADRISRLAGLERIAAIRPNFPGGGSPHSGSPIYAGKISTVGSASATGSSGGNTTTWLSTSGSGRGHMDVDTDDAVDQMSVDADYREIDDRDQSSMMEQSEDGDVMSDEGNASIMSFREGAGSTMSGPTYAKNRASAGGVSGANVGGMSGSMGSDGTDRTLKERVDDAEKKSQPPMGSPEDARIGRLHFD